MMRLLLAQEKPDALLIFNDPRFFTHVFEREDEIHQICPITYWHLWDNSTEGFFPEFNKPIYQSVDLINCINYPTYLGCSKMFPEKTNFVPHALPIDMYYPLPKPDVERFRKELLMKMGKPNAKFICLWVARNARRKRPQDMLLAWKQFLSDLKEKHGHDDAILIMHTDPVDGEGTNIPQCIDAFKVPNVFISKEKLDFANMKILYNCIDCLINTSIAEGFGVPALEALNTGKLCVVSDTGGLTRQVRNHETSEEYGVVMPTDLKTCVGSPSVPYIVEDYASIQTIAESTMKIYEMDVTKREELGKKAREYVQKEFNIDNLIYSWDKTLEECISSWKTKYHPWEMKTF
jgi:glycosyltransferase involved in cell wall biosynthesis